MKKITAIATITATILICNSAVAQPIDFSGIRPHTAREYPKGISFSIPIIPHGGLRDIKSFGHISKFIKALNGFNIPTGSVQSLLELVKDVNNIYGSKFSIDNVVIPQVFLNINYEFFEFSFRGGLVNFTKSDVLNIEKELDLFSIYYDAYGSSYLLTEQQTVLHIKARTLLGGEFWGTIKIPVKTNRYKLKLLLGLGGMIGYLYTHEYTVRVAKEFSRDHLFDTETIKSGETISEMGLRVGFQLDGYKYLRPRFILETMGIVSHDPEQMPRMNLGLNVQIWKLFTLSSSILNFADPEVRIEISREFHKNSEIAIGGGVRNKSFKKDFGYLTIALGGKIVKLTTTLLIEKSRAGLLLGVGLGHYP